MTDELDPQQVSGLTDLDPEAFRAALHAVADAMADYAARVEDYPVFPPIEPGSLVGLFPAEPPDGPAPLAQILDDYRTLIEPNATHWAHPGFMAYFATPASAAGILGEMLMASLGQNTMLWRTSPIGTELESVVVGWLRQGLGLPDAFDGFVTDTASTSSLVALAGARDAAGFTAATDGLSSRPDLGRPRVYASAEAHSSIEKACMTLGLGRGGLVKVPVDDEYRMDPAALAAAIEADVSGGMRPMAVVATIGTTSSTSIDPVPAIAGIAERHGLWLHVDAAYAGAVALLPERREAFAGWERADSVVVNPHKWLFTPLDASLLLTRRMATLRDAFSLVPEYLRTLDRATPVRDINEYTPVLGRRFRALKLWLMLRWFGLEGFRRRIRHHLELAEGFAGWVDADPDFERLAPVPFSTICLRHRPRRFAGREDEADIAAWLDDHNARLMDAVNRTGEVFLSHTRLHGRFAIRVALGHIRAEERHVARAWDLLRREAAALDDDSA
ncbi:MAG TPA: pyridoxal-dependent decarboxylase [Candidatus Limnocylindrales bacterium]|nr:pyridoxal-dependent decarboxylase [Candidatus Limnocylindrales bacterium]